MPGSVSRCGRTGRRRAVFAICDLGCPRAGRRFTFGVDCRPENGEALHRFASGLIKRGIAARLHDDATGDRSGGINYRAHHHGCLLPGTQDALRVVLLDLSRPLVQSIGQRTARLGCGCVGGWRRRRFGARSLGHARTDDKRDSCGKGRSGSPLDHSGYEARHRVSVLGSGGVTRTYLLRLTEKQRKFNPLLPGQSNPTNRAASSTLLRRLTTALAGKSGSGQPSATAFMIT